MSRTRSPKAALRPAVPQLLIERRLVADVPPLDEHDEGAFVGAVDGEPVALPTPCARLLAGYFCSCGSGFRTAYSREPVTRARIEAVTGHWSGFVDSYGEPGTRRATTADEIELQAALAALPVGAVVERHGAGIAPAFAPAIDDEPPWTEGAPWTDETRWTEETPWSEQRF